MPIPRRTTALLNNQMGSFLRRTVDLTTLPARPGVKGYFRGEHAD